MVSSYRTRFGQHLIAEFFGQSARRQQVHRYAEQFFPFKLQTPQIKQRGAGKRIDVAAAALWSELTVEDVTSMDLAYAPPMSPLWDPVQVAARKLAGMLAD